MEMRHVFPISVPALRQRRGDIPALVYHFVERFSRRMDKQITQVSRRSMELLTQYDWPGNVRELENLIERAMIVSRDHTLTIDPSWLGVMHDGNGTAEATPLQGEDWNSRALTGPVTEEHDSTAASQARDIPLGPFRAIERQAILLALTACEGRVYGEGGAAELLQLKPTTLYGKMKKLGIRRRRDSFLID
jgi:formate hydrogenlyase transcriptional activator